MWRNYQEIRAYCAVLLSIVLLAPAAAVALDNRADEVLVTSTREPVRRANAPESGGAIGTDDIADLMPAHPADIMERIPGVHFAWLGGDHNTASIRQPINFNPVYVYLENGVPTRSTGFFETNAFFDMNLQQAARIEVIKGPGSALYGSDAIGGVINLITPDPPKEFGGYVRAEAGSFGFWRALASVGGGTDKNRFRADINLSQADGWRDETEHERYLGTFTWLHDNGNGFTIRTVLFLGLADQDSSGSNLPREDFDNNPKLNLTPIDFRKVDSVRLQSAFEWARDASLISFTPYFRYNRIQLLPAFTLGFDPRVEDTRSYSVGAQFKYRLDLQALNLRIIAGFDVDYSPGERQDRRIEPIKDGRIFVDFTEGDLIYDFDVNFFEFSPYLQMEWRPVTGLRITLGGRLDYVSYDYDNQLDAVEDPDAALKRPASQSLDFTHLSPKFGITYDLTPWLNMFFSYRNAFRVPTAAQMFRPGSSTRSVDLEPVKTDAFEIGVRGRIGNRVSFEVSLFHQTNRDDILVFTDSETAVRQLENSGKTRHKGIELGVSIEILADLRLDVAYARNNHKFLSFIPRTGIDFSGNLINRAPKDIGNVRLTWRPDFLGGGRIEVEWQHLGSYFLDDENSTKYPGHDLLNIRIVYRIAERYDLFLNLQNLTSARYSANGRYTAFNGEELKPGQPLTVFGGIGARF